MATPMLSLWLAILLSAVALFFASWLAWMVLPHHRKEWQALPNEDALLDVLKKSGVAAGQYVFPYCKPEDWKDQAFQQKMQNSPNGNMVFWSGPCSMGKNMLLTVIFFGVVSFSIAYLAAMVIPPTNDRWLIFRFVGTAAIITYASANILNGIWFGRRLLGDFMDGVAFGLITGAIFAALWPAATAAA